MLELIPFTLLALYLIPFMVAAARGHESLTPILITNVLVGWTVVGWFGVFAWAAFAAPTSIPSRRGTRRLRVL